MGTTGKHNSTSGTVDRLRDMIQRGRLRPGDRLPPERDLARMLGVSRPTLRAAIGAFAAAGVFRSRQGSGTFVVKADRPPALDSTPLRLMASLHDITADEMFEARRELEAAAAAASANRILAALAEMLTAAHSEVLRSADSRSSELRAVATAELSAAKREHSDTSR